jgi:hypothetical protein
MEKKSLRKRARPSHKIKSKKPRLKNLKTNHINPDTLRLRRAEAIAL